MLARSPNANLERFLSHSREQAAFLESVTAELTVGESFFFRNEFHFRALRDKVFTEIMRDNAGQREIRVWSAGCATGEEPYSVAILLDQLLAERGSWLVSVLGTDLNLAFLERAREARYRQWSFRQTDVNQDRRYFTGHGEWFNLSPKVSERVRFAYFESGEGRLSLGHDRHARPGSDPVPERGHLSQAGGDQGDHRTLPAGPASRRLAAARRGGVVDGPRLRL